MHRIDQDKLDDDLATLAVLAVAWVLVCVVLPICLVIFGK